LPVSEADRTVMVQPNSETGAAGQIWFCAIAKEV
jgi:hypothetical protein